MEKRDMKKYASYLPIRWEHQNTLAFLEELIPGYRQGVFFSKFYHRYGLKVYYGDRQVMRVFEKEKGKYREIPLTVWLDLTQWDKSLLNKDTWEWIKEARKKYGKSESVHVKTENRKKSLLEI